MDRALKALSQNRLRIDSEAMRAGGARARNDPRGHVQDPVVLHIGATVALRPPATPRIEAPEQVA